MNKTKNPRAVELGKLGGRATFKKHGSKHFSRMGKISMGIIKPNEPTKAPDRERISASEVESQ